MGSIQMKSPTVTTILLEWKMENMCYFQQRWHNALNLYGWNLTSGTTIPLNVQFYGIHLSYVLYVQSPYYWLDVSPRNHQT